MDEGCETHLTFIPRLGLFGREAFLEPSSPFRKLHRLAPPQIGRCGWLDYFCFYLWKNLSDISGADHRNAACEELEVTDGPSQWSRVLQLVD